MRSTTTFTFDDANQLVSSTTDGVTTRYAYDATGRLVWYRDARFRRVPENTAPNSSTNHFTRFKRDSYRHLRTRK